MTAYFDDLRREVREIPPGDGWLQALGAIESRVANEVMLVTGDREFPDDLREKILETINMKAVYDLRTVPATKSAVKYALATRSSGLLEALHSIFHTLAGRRIKTRFGFLSDSPRAILKARDSYDAGER